MKKLLKAIVAMLCHPDKPVCTAADKIYTMLMVILIAAVILYLYLVVGLGVLF